MGQPKKGTTLLQRFEDSYMPEPMSGCWIWTKSTLGPKRLFYGAIRKNGEKKYAHRVSFELFIGPIPRGKLVLHRCDVPLCVNPRHLFLGTHKENSDDKIKKGRERWASGENHPCAKLKKEDVLAIRRSGLSRGALSKVFGIDRRTIKDIVEGKTWTQITA